MTLSRARVSSRSRAPRARPKTRLSRASPAAAPAVRVISRAAACWSGALPRPFRTSARYSSVAAGSASPTSRASLGTSVQPEACRRLLGDRHFYGTVRVGRVRNPPDGLDVAGQLVTIDDLKLRLVPGRRAGHAGGYLVQLGGQPVPAPREDRHRLHQAATDLGGGGRQVVLGEHSLAGYSLGEHVPARADLDGRAQRPEPAQGLRKASVRRRRLTAGPARAANTHAQTSKASAIVPPAAGR